MSDSFGDLEPLPEAVAVQPLTKAQVELGPKTSPKKLILTWDDQEWEAFTRECVALRRPYHLLRSASGSGDRGVDVAAFYGSNGFVDGWDAYQCKHYATVLHPSDALVEMAKLLRTIHAGIWPAPQEYFFVAPRGCGPTLSRLLQDPEALKAKFIEALDDGTIGLDAQDRANLRQQAEQTDFKLFSEIDPDELIELYRKSANFLSRFGGALPTAPEPDPVPGAPGDHELEYLALLYEAYSERYGETFDFDKCLSDPEIMKHLFRQREYFYSAESLERFVRDLVPPGTFERFQQDIFDGVIETHEEEWPDGMRRLTEVLKASQYVTLDNSAIVQAQRPKDRSGVCHQLAGFGRLRWTRGANAATQ